MLRDMRIENLALLRRLTVARRKVRRGTLTWGTGSQRVDATAEYLSDLTRQIRELLWLNRTIRNVWSARSGGAGCE